MRHTLYWTLMNEEFGEARAASLHTDLTLSSLGSRTAAQAFEAGVEPRDIWIAVCDSMSVRSEEHTSELQSRFDLVCRLLLEKKKLTKTRNILYNTKTNIDSTQDEA